MTPSLNSWPITRSNRTLRLNRPLSVKDDLRPAKGLAHGPGGGSRAVHVYEGPTLEEV